MLSWDDLFSYHINLPYDDITYLFISLHYVEKQNESLQDLSIGNPSKKNYKSNEFNKSNYSILIN